MLDPRFVAENPDLVKDTLRRRQADPNLISAVDTIVAGAAKRSALIQERDALLNRRNTVSKEIGNLMKAGKKAEAEQLKAEIAAGNARVPLIEQELAAVESLQHGLLMTIPNLLHADVPDGATE